MAISAIDKELMRYFTRLDEAQKKSLLEMIKSFLKVNDSGEAITLNNTIKNWMRL